MFPKIEILHKPQATFPKYTLIMDGEVLHVTNSLNPSELLDLIGVPHNYKVEVPNE